MSKKSYVIFALVITGGLLVAPFIGQQLVFAQEANSDKIKKLCENRYDTYKKMGKESTQKIYSHLTYLPDCLKLFEDPNWNFKGKEKIDKHYEKYYQITSQINPLINNYENQNLEIKKISANKVGNHNYVVKVRMCADDKIVLEPKFFVISEKEYFLAKGTREIKENACSFVMLNTNTQDPGKLVFLPFDGNYMPSKYLKIKSVF